MTHIGEGHPVMVAAQNVARCMDDEFELDLQMATELEQLIDSFIGTPDPRKAPLKDGTQPTHSATSAEGVAKLTPAYQELKRRRLEAEVESVLARARYQIALTQSWREALAGVPMQPQGV